MDRPQAHVVVDLLCVVVGASSVFGVFECFFPTLLSLCFIALFITIYQYFSFIIIVVYIIVCCCYYFPLSSWLCVTGAWVGAGFAGGARGWVAGRAGFWNVLATWVPGHPASMGDSGVNKRFFLFQKMEDKAENAWQI